MSYIPPIDLKEGLKSLELVIRDGRLQAQNPTPNPSVSCAYRSEVGSKHVKCAIGAMIPDSVCTKQWLGNYNSHRVGGLNLHFTSTKEEHTNILFDLSMLQRKHDEWARTACQDFYNTAQKTASDTVKLLREQFFSQMNDLRLAVGLPEMRVVDRVW